MLVLMSITLKEPKFSVPKDYRDNKTYILHLLQKGMEDKVKSNLIAEEDIPKYVETTQVRVRFNCG